jgi:hypothetical protein
LKDRKEIQNKIAQLSAKREAFIKEKRAALNAGEDDDLGTAINNSILIKAIELGFDKRK